ncbi:PD-(D/E)XK nuclease family protein [Halonatronum saccharophilum]|uniref:PD-(D/E)XK nuclease family protein n=1 Tax=Halonatronum saccharophilum TaxID=150060 RepID=UPI0004829652|nr:PD-(D/E)XK nuclease family protein [Halonatronum saccharophilum]
MLKGNLEDMYFSASALKTYETCRLKFKRRYLDGLYWPSDWVQSPEDKNIFKEGQDFHTLAQRYYERGRIVDPTNLISLQIEKWLENLISFRPYNDNAKFYPEQEIRVNESGIKLMAKYDLLYLGQEGQGIIYDWKTYKKQPKLEYWENNLQTIVYRYLLVKGGGNYHQKGSWPLEDIILIYWNPRYPKDYQPLNYTQWQFERDEDRIKKLIKEIKNLEIDEFYPTDNNKACLYCEYRPLCHGEEALKVDVEEEDLNLDLDWDQIEEFDF